MTPTKHMGHRQGRYHWISQSKAVGAAQMLHSCEKLWGKWGFWPSSCWPFIINMSTVRDVFIFLVWSSMHLSPILVHDFIFMDRISRFGQGQKFAFLTSADDISQVGQYTFRMCLNGSQLVWGVKWRGWKWTPDSMRSLCKTQTYSWGSSPWKPKFLSLPLPLVCWFFSPHCHFLQTIQHGWPHHRFKHLSFQSCWHSYHTAGGTNRQ